MTWPHRKQENLGTLEKQQQAGHRIIAGNLDGEQDA